VNYRYYFRADKWRKNNDFIPYAGLFCRYGTVEHDFDKGYETDYEKETEYHYSGGVFSGLLINIERHFGIDAYFGLFYKKKRYEYILENAAPGNPPSVYLSDNFGFRIGLNCYFWFRENARKNRQ
jgi:hypothetical protein